MFPRTNISLMNRVVAALLLGVALAIAVSLVVLGQSGGFDMVIFVSVGALATVAALASLELGLMALILIASTDGFLKGFSPGWHTQLLKDYLIALCLLRWAWLSVLGNRRQSLRHPLSLPILVFGGWVAVQLVNARAGSFVVGLAGLRMWTIWLPIFFIAYDTIVSRQQFERIVLFVIALFVPLSIYGITQYYIGLDHLYKLGPGFNVHRYQYYAGAQQNELRPPSTMVSPHAFAGGLTTVALMAVGAGIYFSKNRVIQVVTLAAVPLMGVALMITAVRNAAASAVIGVVALLAVIRRADLAVIAVILGAIAITQVDSITGGEANRRLMSVIEDREYTKNRILGRWNFAVQFALEHPLGSGIATGMGTGRLSNFGRELVNPEGRSVAVENEYGRSLTELGIPGFLFFVWLLFSITRNNYKSYRGALHLRDRWLLAGIFASCFSMLARLLTGPALYGWPEAPLFWIFVAMAARMPEIERDEEMRDSAPKPENRAIVLGEVTLPWASAEREAQAAETPRSSR